MIGMDVLQRFALHLDLPQGKATIFEEAPQTSCKATHLAYFGQIPCVVGWFGDTSSWFMIDTGKLGGGEGDLSHGAFGRLRQRGLLTVTGRTLSISAGGEAEHRSGRVKSLVLADQLYTEAAFSEAESCRLGLAHLSRFTVTLDFPNNVAYFDLPQPLKAAGPLASLGLLTRWQDGKLVVADAHANGRAAKASIRIGDQIVAVDGIDLTEELPLAPPRPSATQRNVELSIARGRSRYNLNVAPTYLVAKSSKPPATAIASRSTLPTQPVLTARSSARRRRMWRR